jgi:hypothetical protein
MCKVSREPSTAVGCAELAGEAAAVGGPPGIRDLLLGNGLGDAGVHGSSLSMESWFATAIRMN